ncbi:MAG: sulfotransferase [Phormidesmis sp.]
MQSTDYPKLFVVGCPRSGTSWVTKLIASHHTVVEIPIETHAYPFLYEPFLRLPAQRLPSRLRSWKGIVRRYGLWPLLLGFESSDIWRGILRNYEILNTENSHGLRLLADYSTFESLLQTAQLRPGPDLEKAEQLIGDLFDLFFQEKGQAGSTLLEKTPMHIRYCDRILQRFPNAQIIEVIRDGRDVCASFQALAQQFAWADMGTAAVMHQWKSCIALGEKWRSHSEFADRIHTVRFEALKADAEDQLQQIFSFANLDTTPQQVSEIVQSADIRRVKDKGEGQYVRKGIVGDWKERLSAEDVAMCEAIAGEQLKYLGYM